MNRAMGLLMVVVAFVAWRLPAPSGGNSGPGAIPSDAECAECGMSIVDARYAAAAAIESEDGIKILFFDDAGCLFDHERAKPGLLVVRRWFAVDAGGAWRDGERVAFRISASIATPMGTGLQAFDPQTSEARAIVLSGERLVTTRDAAAYRQRWMESRFGKPR
ncbi:MAG: hypothetical protein K2Y21_16280 [Phycisphaerales bacterium]|nr:hypothetical protein [Phycisphaerales bacterium]